MKEKSFKTLLITVKLYSLVSFPLFCTRNVC